MTLSKELGDAGEAFAAALLRARGHRVREIGGNNPVIDLEVSASVAFRVSVKASRSRRHIRLGSESSISRLRDDDFVFAFVPPEGVSELRFEEGGYDLLIVPGRQAREDALWVHRTYREATGRSGQQHTGSAGIMIKSYSKREPQRVAWTRCEACLNNWTALPSP